MQIAWAHNYDKSTGKLLISSQECFELNTFVLPANTNMNIYVSLEKWMPSPVVFINRYILYNSHKFILW